MDSAGVALDPIEQGDLAAYASVMAGTPFSPIGVFPDLNEQPTMLYPVQGMQSIRMRSPPPRPTPGLRSFVRRKWLR